MISSILMHMFLADQMNQTLAAHGEDSWLLHIWISTIRGKPSAKISPQSQSIQKWLVQMQYLKFRCFNLGKWSSLNRFQKVSQMCKSMSVKKKKIQGTNQVLTGTQNFTLGASMVEVNGKGLPSLPQIPLFWCITGTKVWYHQTYCWVYFEM